MNELGADCLAGGVGGGEVVGGPWVWLTLSRRRVADVVRVVAVGAVEVSSWLRVKAAAMVGTTAGARMWVWVAWAW